MAVNRRVALTIIISVLLFSAVAGTSSVHAAGDFWVSKAPMHEARTGVGVAVVNGKIYAIGGANQEGFRATNEEYDPAINTWTFKAPMPTPRSAFGVAFSHNKIYCIGGYIPGGATGVNEAYDPATDTWETKAPMPTPRLNLQGNVVNGKIYLIGGNPNGTLNEVYDPATDSWTTKAPMPTGASGYASAVVDNKICVIGGNSNQIYDTENDSWNLGAPTPLPAVLASAGATTGVFAPERIYVFGADADLPFWQLTTRKFTAQSYDPKTDTWTVCASVPTGRFDANVAVVNDKLYLIGGFTIEFSTGRFNPNPIYTYSSASQEYTPFGYGTVPPAVAVVSIENKTYTTNNVSLTFNLDKPAVWMGYSFDGQDNVTIDGNITLYGLSNGPHNLTVYAKDTYGNIGASETINFTIAKETEPFLTAIVATATVALVAFVGAVLLFYFAKIRKNQASNASKGS
jgi:N-acetylneuraminic acid mutarotase